MPTNRRQAKQRANNFLIWAWPLYFLVLWQVLLSAQNPGLMADDSGEMAASARNLGLPHPPGYPLFNLLGYFATFLPVGTIAFRLNLFSALLVLAALAITLWTCWELGKGKAWLNSKQGWVLLAIMGIIFISNRGLFAQCLTAKGCIYALNLFLISLVIWLRVWSSTLSPQGRGGAKKAQENNASSKVLLGVLFLWAVGMANHWQTQVLWVPFILFWMVQAKAAWNVKTFIYSLVLILVGLSLYLYLPFRAAVGVDPCWGNPVTWKGFWWVVSRKLVQETETWVQPLSFYIHSAQWIFKTVVFLWLPGLVLLVLLGGFSLWRKNREIFTSLMSLALPLFLAVALVHEEKNQYLVPVYLVALAGVAVVFGFVGMGWVLEKIPSKGILRRIFSAVLVAASAGWLLHARGLEDKSRYTLMEDFGTNVLKGLPRDALLLADGDHYVMSIWYLQTAQGKRPDVIFQPSVFLYHNWGWAQLPKRAPDLREAIYSTPLFTGRIEALTKLSLRHPFCYSLGREYLEPVLKRVPGEWIIEGLHYRWDRKSPDQREVRERVERAMRSQRSRSELPKEIDPSTRQILRYYAEQPFGVFSFINKDFRGP